MDYVVRQLNRASFLPRYSIRVRSVGVFSHFGGQGFLERGRQFLSIMKKCTLLNEHSDVLEIGCGCGRIAFSLAEYLADGSYVGIDVDKKAIEASAGNSYFSRSGFTFEHIDVFNEVYNPDGVELAGTFRFPVDDGTIDFVYLASVFTHMYDADISLYIKEIGRVLKPGGQCLMTAFLADHGLEGRLFSFPHRSGNHYFMDAKIKEKGVCFHQRFFEESFGECSMTPASDPLLGAWRKDNSGASVAWAQDILVFSKGSGPPASG